MCETKPLILIIEDDVELALLNARLLKRKGYDVMVTNTAEEARDFLKMVKPALFILDIGLPDGDGFELCEEFKQRTDAPVLFLTGRKETRDKVAGLQAGGDYYITKPYENAELTAAVESLLQKEEQIRKKIAEVSVIERGALTLKLHESKAYIGERNAELTPKEFAVLALLVQNEENELSSEMIYETVWEADMNIDTGIIRKYISVIKKKLDVENTDDFDIISEYGGIYKFTTM